MVNIQNEIKVVGYTGELCVGSHVFLQVLDDVTGDSDGTVPDVVF